MGSRDVVPEPGLPDIAFGVGESGAGLGAGRDHRPCGDDHVDHVDHVDGAGDDSCRHRAAGDVGSCRRFAGRGAEHGDDGGGSPRGGPWEAGGSPKVEDSQDHANTTESVANTGLSVPETVATTPKVEDHGSSSETNPAAAPTTPAPDAPVRTTAGPAPTTNRRFPERLRRFGGSLRHPQQI